MFSWLEPAGIVAGVVTTAAIAAAGFGVLARQRLAETERRAADLTDGVVVLADGREIVDCSPGARRVLGCAPGADLREVLARKLGPDQEDVLEVLDQLVETGRPMRRLATERDGKPCEILGEPSGGEIRLVLRDGSLAVSEIERAEARIASRERALAATWYEQRTIETLLASGSAIGWQRAPDRKSVV